MRKRYRSTLGILFDLLKTIDEIEDPIITRLITYVNVPHNRLKVLLERLLREGYIKEQVIKGKKMFFLTKKGRQLLKELKTLKKILAGLGIMF